MFDACPSWRAVLRVKRVKDGSFVATAETVVVLLLVLFERILSPQKREKNTKINPKRNLKKEGEKTSRKRGTKRNQNRETKNALHIDNTKTNEPAKRIKRNQ